MSRAVSRHPARPAEKGGLVRLVIYPGLADDRLDQVRAAVPGVEIVDAADEATAIESIGLADAFFGKMTPAILAAATRLRWVQSPTASLEHYLFPALQAHPATLTNMRGIHSKPIAEQVLGYVLGFARNLPAYVRLQERATWAPLGGEAERSNYVTGPGTVTAIDRATRDVAGSSLGIVGLGEIGREVAHRAAAFEMTVRAVDARPDVAVPGVDEVVPPDRLDSVLERSDYVVVTLPHTPATVGLFGMETFGHMRPEGYFINVGRGAVVVLDDLVAALRRGTIAGAALDVFEIEPLPSDHPLWAMENVIITPHVAGFAPSVAGRYLGLFIENLTRFRDGRALLNEVDKSRWF
jgi:phosphoglycerate dehydrogenase-like enzyme